MIQFNTLLICHDDSSQYVWKNNVTRTVPADLSPEIGRNFVVQLDAISSSCLAEIVTA
jgi:hypothetical protein